MKYRKKPVVIEAFQLRPGSEAGRNYFPDWFKSAMHRTVEVEGDKSPLTRVRINTLEGVMYANVGDFIIQGVKGELYPCKPDIFEATYEKVLPRCSHLGCIITLHLNELKENENGKR
jgi:hypothetical protein